MHSKELITSILCWTESGYQYQGESFYGYFYWLVQPLCGHLYWYLSYLNVPLVDQICILKAWRVGTSTVGCLWFICQYQGAPMVEQTIGVDAFKRSGRHLSVPAIQLCNGVLPQCSNGHCEIYNHNQASLTYVKKRWQIIYKQMTVLT